MKDRSIRLFDILTGKSVVSIFEPLSGISETQTEGNSLLQLDEVEYEKKMNLEKEL